MLTQSPSTKDTTIYQYTLIRKINHGLFLSSYYPSLIFTYLIISTIYHGWQEGLHIVIAFPTVIIIHGLILLLLSLKSSAGSRDRWKFIIRFPWIGFMPNTNYYSLSSFVSYHMQLLWIGCLIVLASYAWTSLLINVHLLFIHLWLIYPRILIIIKLRKQSKHGFLKFNLKDTSYYRQ
jgi:hypothetical protein